jgi:hypothetical protein
MTFCAPDMESLGRELGVLLDHETVVVKVAGEAAIWDHTYRS